MIVRNVNGSADNHWAKYGGQAIPNYCPEADCVSKTEVGAHVQSANPKDDRWYIVPLCSGHNAMVGQELNITNNIRLVSANVSETCGK